MKNQPHEVPAEPPKVLDVVSAQPASQMQPTAAHTEDAPKASAPMQTAQEQPAVNAPKPQKTAKTRNAAIVPVVVAIAVCAALIALAYMSL